MKLYELSREYSEFLAIAGQEDFDPQTIADTLEGIKGEIEEKGKNVAAFSQNIEAEITAMKEAEKKIALRRKTLERKVEWMKNYLRENMERCGITKIECPEFRVTLGNPSEICDVFDEDVLPEDYFAVKKSPDKKLIMQALKDGYEVPGAKIGHGVPRLSIR